MNVSWLDNVMLSTDSARGIKQVISTALSGDIAEQIYAARIGSGLADDATMLLSRAISDAPAGTAVEYLSSARRVLDNTSGALRSWSAGSRGSVSFDGLENTVVKGVDLVDSMMNLALHAW